MKLLPVCALLLPFLNLSLKAEELKLSPEDFPRIPATSPEDALSTFEIEPGLQLTLAAHEPDVMDPIAMAFDETGRAYVVEMRGYSERREEALGRIRLLTDLDGDGDFDESVIFKEGLKWPTAVLPYRGGIFVGASPDVIYLRDTDGDGKADEERLIFTGFGEGKPELNMQALFNSFRWGPDNRIWGATAANGGVVTKPDDPDFVPVPVRGADFSFDPEKLDLRPENGTAQYGMSFDSDGRRFVCSNSRHLIWVAYERQNVLRNPLYSLPSPLTDIPIDGAAAPVFRISADEPWRIVRTRLRVAGVVKGVVEGGGRVSGYFTSASGVHLYWGTALGEAYRNNAFIGDVGSNLVHRKVISSRPDSYDLTAARADPSETTEFLRSSDNWFRPTSFATGPDGALYLTDMYRETIEHPWSLPAPIKEHLDLNSGFDRGRIYRVAATGEQPPLRRNLQDCSDAELDAFLNAPIPSQWHVETARRLLYERGLARPQETPSPFPAALGSDEITLTAVEASVGGWKKSTYLNSLRTPAALETAWSDAFPALPTIAPELARLIGKSRDVTLVEMVAGDFASEAKPALVAGPLRELAEGLKTGFAPGDAAELKAAGFDGPAISYAEFVSLPTLEPLIRKCRALIDTSPPVIDEAEAAISILSFIGGEEAQALFGRLLLNGSTPPAVKDLLVGAIRDPQLIAGAFPSLSAPARVAASDVILRSPEASGILLRLLDQGTLAPGDIPALTVEGLRNHHDAETQRLAGEVLPPVVLREDVIRKYRDAISISGNREAGRLAFAKACLSCHVSHEGEGIELGPAINTFANAGRESLLERILDPNREVAPQYQAYLFTMNDGAVWSGLIRAETPEEVTLRLPGGIDRTFPRREVRSMAALGQSLMPEGLEAALSVQEMADLLSYLEPAPEVR